MKAFICRQYGPPEVLEMCEVATPTPKHNELLIRVCATTVTSADSRVRSFSLPPGFGVVGRLALGINGPRQPILGTELAGEVVQIGRAVKNFCVGDQVLAFLGASMGCHAEYRCVAETGPVAQMPPNLSYEQAAAMCFGGSTMLDFYHRGGLASGERVLINGASGGVGTAAVQLAKYVGAHVTAVCSAGNVELVRSIGADAVIDYTREDFTRSGGTFDVIVDTVGNAPFSRSGSSLKPGGRLLMLVAGLSELLQVPWINLRSDRAVVAGPAKERVEYVQQLAKLAAAGKFLPVIDRSFPFEQIVEAHRYVDKGRKRGNVCIAFGAQGLASHFDTVASRSLSAIDSGATCARIPPT